MSKRLELTLVQNKINLEEKVGGLSKESKMPGWVYSLPAAECVTGSKLAKVPGTVCHNCYAMKGRYRFDSVQNALYRRLERVLADPWGWADNMVKLLRKKAKRFTGTPKNPQPTMRWHSAGDVQSEEHLKAIISVAERTQRVRVADGSRRSVRHWLPTREATIVSRVLGSGVEVPPNLCIRLSGNIVDGPLPMALANKFGLTVSGVTRDPNLATCPAPSRGNQCGDCRRCFDKRARVVYYKIH